MKKLVLLITVLMVAMMAQAQEMMSDATFLVTLSSQQEVPAVMSDAVGSASISLMGRTLSLTGDFADLSSPVIEVAGTPAHIHMAAMGDNGDVVFPLNVSASMDGMSGIFSGTFELSDAQLEAFKVGHLYLNLHTEMHPSGELRAQLTPDMMSMDMMTPALMVSPQSLTMGHITIDAITLAQDGFVVVHAFDINGELVLTPPLGLTYLTAGHHENVMVTLDPMLLEDNGYGMNAKNVLPMLHIDANANGSYEFPEGGDVPVMVNDMMVVAELELQP